jgi:hypothetical protein
MLEGILKKRISIKEFNSEKVVNCIIRGKQIKVTPEEIVRQKVLKCLIEDTLVPASNIQVEYHLGKKEKGKKTRADIVVFHHKKPIISIECKNENIAIGVNELEQVSEYDKTLKSGFVVTTNGRQVNLYKKVEDKFLRMKNTRFSFDDLCEGLNLDPSAHRSLGIKMSELIESVRTQIIPPENWKDNMLSLDSIPVLTFSYLHFDLFHYIKNSFPDNWSIPSKLGSYQKNLGLFERRMTNAGGGRRIELQRSFEFLDKKKQVRVLNLSYKRQIERTPNPKGFYQIITCSMDTNKSSTVEIQLTRNLKVLNGEKVQLTHNGVMSRIKSAELIDFIEQRCPYLLEGRLVNLGEFSIKHEIWDSNSQNIKDHIGRMFDYAVCREEFKKSKGINSK